MHSRIMAGGVHVGGRPATILTISLPMFLPPKITVANLSGVLTELSICILDSCSDTHRSLVLWCRTLLQRSLLQLLFGGVFMTGLIHWRYLAVATLQSGHFPVRSHILAVLNICNVPKGWSWELSSRDTLSSIERCSVFCWPCTL